ncbi:hypothetical protein BCR34DRAFT_501508, partial [Clohesyomyces aquaticus]
IGEELGETRQRERANQIRSQMGVIGKVHNIVVHIRASLNYTADFKNLASRSILLDNCMR